MSDDLLMGAITQHYGLEESALLALRAGVDVLLISQNSVKNEPRAAARVVAAIELALKEWRLSRKTVRAAIARVAALRARLAP